MSLTPKLIFEDKIANHLKEDPSLGCDINATYLFNITGDTGGIWSIALNSHSQEVKTGSIENPQCTITISDIDLVNLVQGTLNPQMAFMTGKLKVKGDFGLALKLGKILKV